MNYRLNQEIWNASCPEEVDMLLTMRSSNRKNSLTIAQELAISQWKRGHFQTYTDSTSSIFPFLTKNFLVWISSKDGRVVPAPTLWADNIRIHSSGIEHLGGFPEKLDGDLEIVGEKNLTSLEGLPKYIRGDFTCISCYYIETLKNSGLQKVHGNFMISSNSTLENLDGIPKIHGKEIQINFCTKLSELPELQNAGTCPEISFCGCPLLEQKRNAAEITWFREKHPWARLKVESLPGE